MVFVSSWRLLAFSQNFAFESKARQKYCEKGAPSGVVGSCPRIVWPISSGHAALVVQNGRQKFIEHLIKIIQNSIGNHENSIPNRPTWCPRNAPKVILEARRFQNGSWYHHLILFWWVFGATWAILDAFWAPAGRQGGPKIDRFGTRMRQNVEK